MSHGIHRVTGFSVTGPHSLRIEFDDGLVRVIDFEPVLEGELFGPLRDPKLFAAVTLDVEAGTLVWPNGADLDPESLHDWPTVVAAMTAMARRWRSSSNGGRG